MIQRRSFIAGIFAAGFAPAIGHSGILMPVKKIAQPRFWFMAGGGSSILHSGEDPFGQHGYVNYNFETLRTELNDAWMHVAAIEDSWAEHFQLKQEKIRHAILFGKPMPWCEVELLP